MERMDIKNPVWKNLVLNKIDLNLNFLAAKILLSRMQLNIKYTNSTVDIDKAATEIFELYFKSKDFPSAKKDISLLLNM